MVVVDRVETRIQRLEELIERLEKVRQAGEDAYLADDQKRAATERWLQVAIQICIDLATQVVTEQSARPPTDYRAVFASLAFLDDLREFATAVERLAESTSEPGA